MKHPILSDEFKSQSARGIIELIATAGTRPDVDCMNLNGYCPSSAYDDVYALVSPNDVVILMIYWLSDPTEEPSDDAAPVQRLIEFTREYKKAMKYAGITLPHISSVLVTNTVLPPLTKVRGITIYQGITLMRRVPYVHYSIRYHAVARPQFVAFRLWCEKQGYITRDPDAFEDIDADYDEIEYGIDDDEDDSAFLERYLSGNYDDEEF